MEKKKAPAGTSRTRATLRAEDYRALSERILRHVNSEASRVDFLRELAAMLLRFSRCDRVDLRVQSEDKRYRCEIARRSPRNPVIEVTRCRPRHQDPPFACADEGDPLDEICRMVAEKRFSPASTAFTQRGSFWTGNVHQWRSLDLGLAEVETPRQRAGGLRRCLSLAVVPLVAATETIGLLQLQSNRENYFRKSDIECLEDVAPTLALALVSQFAQASLRERIKELTCLYGLGQLAERPGVRLEEIFREVVQLLPPAWQYPGITAARLTFDGRFYATAGFEECGPRQSASLIIQDRQRGSIEVGYTREKPLLDEGPFVQEERSLIDTVARQIAVLVERREAAENHGRMQEQLRHADRLATIGQLSAGIAHELNEPLGNILAFAQLARKEPGAPEQVAEDLDKIVATSLHAREIIKKLMLFARQMPPRKTRVDLNVVVEDGLYLLASRCLKEGALIERDLADHLPEIVADPSQLNQVLVNLVVNAIQAMPAGGSVRITTRATRNGVILAVEDTGVGMDREVLAQIFTPFFTTKDIHEGTGLGLPVVHGIVLSHGGTISVQSQPGKGSLFEVCLPATRTDDGKGTIRS